MSHFLIQDHLSALSPMGLLKYRQTCWEITDYNTEKNIRMNYTRFDFNALILSQHRFVKHKSCQTKIISLFDWVTILVGGGNAVGVI